MEGKTVGIIGGGPAGLLLARLLQLRGVAVKVYERDADSNARAQGATLDLHEDTGLAALEAAGLTDEFYKLYRPDAGKLRIVDAAGRIYLDDHETGEGYTESRPEIDRGPLRKMLAEALDEGTIEWNRHFKSLQQTGKGWQIIFDNGASAYADIVIGADGANSKIRHYLSKETPLYCGVTMVEGNVDNAAENCPKLWQLTCGGKVMALHNRQSIILSAKGNGALSFYTGMAKDRDWADSGEVDFEDYNSVRNWFKRDFAGWDVVWEELFSSVQSWFVPRPMLYFPYNQKWASQPNLTIIGDAAHRMPPYAGEGVNTAMRDSLELAERLVSEPDPANAIAGYEAEMLQRSAAVVEDSVENTALFHSTGALEAMVRMMRGE